MVELTVTSPVLTNEEAVRFLRLDTDFDEPGDAVRALHRLVRQDKLRPLRCGKSYKFTLAELERFIIAEVGPSDSQADGNGG
ncbi:MAG: helix-turn-helix domain-containing protein [Planctomycetes bacterium]|nr:helix-turn-helix domain-containing protein [Planctomycetota bacterium]